jgi:ADP-heptose:LPS heptosyltransferase
MRQLVIRTGAMGDVLDTTPIIARLKREDPFGEIDVETQHRYLFWGNPNVCTLHRRTGFDYDRVINLDMAYENQLRMRSGIECYSMVAFGDAKTSGPLELNFTRPPPAQFDYANCIAFHPARSWPSRTLPREFWQDLVNYITKRGWMMVAVASRQDWPGPWGPSVCDTTDKLTLAQQAAVINACAAFLCSDNGMMIVAQATKAPVVAMLTISAPWFAERERRDRIGWGFHSITASVPCMGCGHRISDPTTRFACIHNGGRENECVRSFRVEDVAHRVIAVARHHAEAFG